MLNHRGDGQALEYSSRIEDPTITTTTFYRTKHDGILVRADINADDTKVFHSYEAVVSCTRVGSCNFLVLPYISMQRGEESYL